MIDEIEDIIKLLIKMLIRAGAHLFYVFPVKNNRILFMCQEMDNYCCNPKYIHRYMQEKYGNDYEYIWVFKKPNEHNIIAGVKFIKYYSLQRLFYMATSKIIVCNIQPDSLYPSRKNQLIINTWHAGGAYKKVGKTITKGKKDEWSYIKQLCDVNVYLSSSNLFTKYNILEGYPIKGEIWNTGMPRNDIFFNKEKVEITKNNVKNLFNIENRIILYAPTYRGEMKVAKSSEIFIDFDKISTYAEFYFNEKVSILIRGHYLTRDLHITNNIKDVSSYPDMQELLCAADILITDYSSSIWDYSLLGRPCFLYVPDLDEYESEDRGFFTPIETWPGIVCHDMEELCYEIEHIDENRCKEIARKHQEYAGSFENGLASEVVCKKIVDFCNIKDTKSKENNTIGG